MIFNKLREFSAGMISEARVAAHSGLIPLSLINRDQRADSVEINVANASGEPHPITFPADLMRCARSGSCNAR